MSTFIVCTAQSALPFFFKEFKVNYLQVNYSKAKLKRYVFNLFKKKNLHGCVKTLRSICPPSRKNAKKTF